MSIPVPPPLGLGRPSRESIQYRLVVVQHPKRARSCGFGEKDKRPVDPPPILQLYKERPDGVLERVSEAENISHLIVQCDLYSVDQKHIRNIVYHPASINPAYPNSTATVMSFQEPLPVRNLLGTVVSNAYQLMDLDNQLGIFFIFPDLSIRTEGRFRLKFKFIDLSAGDPLTMSTSISHEVFCDPFSVYAAKHFPGMTGSTALSQCFARQGIKISVRKGPGLKRSSDEVFRPTDPSNQDDNIAPGPDSRAGKETIKQGGENEENETQHRRSHDDNSTSSNNNSSMNISSGGVLAADLNQPPSSSSSSLSSSLFISQPEKTSYSRIDISNILSAPSPPETKENGGIL